jgi:hypothetical protein
MLARQASRSTALPLLDDLGLPTGRPGRFATFGFASLTLDRRATYPCHDPHMDPQSILRCPSWAAPLGCRTGGCGSPESAFAASSSERRSRRKLGHVRDNIEVPTCRDEAVVFRVHKLGKADRFLDRTLKSRPHVGH